MDKKAINLQLQKCLLNPGLSYNVDDDGNEAKGGDSALVSALQDERSIISASAQGVSTLRARNAQLLSDTDPRYAGKKVRRAQLGTSASAPAPARVRSPASAPAVTSDGCDPSLEKYFLLEDSEDESDESAPEDEEEDERSHKPQHSSTKEQVLSSKTNKTQQQRTKRAQVVTTTNQINRRKTLLEDKRYKKSDAINANANNSYGETDDMDESDSWEVEYEEEEDDVEGGSGSEEGEKDMEGGSGSEEGEADMEGRSEGEVEEEEEGDSAGEEEEEIEEESDVEDMEEGSEEEENTSKSLPEFSFQDDYSKYGDDDNENSSDQNESDDDKIGEDDDGEGDSDSNEHDMKGNMSCMTADDFDVGSDDEEVQGNRKSKMVITSSKASKSKIKMESSDGMLIKSEDEDSGRYSDERELGESDEDDEEEDDEEEEDEDEDEEDEEEDEEEEEEEVDVKAVNMESKSVEQQKATSVTNQLDLYGKLYESRIGLQKVLSASHQLAQPDVYESILRQSARSDAVNTSASYKSCLITARTAAVSLIDAMLDLQDAVTGSHPDTQHIFSATTTTAAAAATHRKPATVNPGDEEITSSEDEDEEQKNKAKQPTPAPARGRKRGAATLDQFEEELNKRHCSLRGYRDKVVQFWEERAKLLSSSSSSGGARHGGFTAFEETFAAQLQRLLGGDRDKLRARTQLRSVARNNLAPTVGGSLPSQGQQQQEEEVDPETDIPVAVAVNKLERYDSEIYDDTDFYSRSLEELLKMKMLRGTERLTSAQFYSLTHSLRSKNKKMVVDTRRSKGRKLKYDVQSKLLQFVAPRGAPEMEDEAIDMVVASLFGRGTIIASTIDSSAAATTSAATASSAATIATADGASKEE